MAKHEITLTIAHDIPVGNKDIEVAVRVDDTAFGRVKISRGSIEWLPAGRSKRRHAMNWTKFAELMCEHGAEKK